MTDIDRIVALIDMDCFFCQVEEKYNPALKGKPIAVVQYNQWKGGGIIAVNYEARAKGVTRHMRGDEAKEKCPEIELPQVPSNRGKANISKYREAGKDVANVLQEFTSLLERASVDEAYLDITQPVNDRIASYRERNSIKPEALLNTYVLGYDSLDRFIMDIYKETECDDMNFDHERSLKLLVGAIVVSEIRAAVYEKTGYRCSAGIAHNKIIAKLVCGMNKPNKQTVLPFHCVPVLFQSLPINKIKSLGGKFGTEICQKLNIVNMIDLLQFTEKDLQKHFNEKNGSWLYNIARGIDTEPVTPRFCPKSIGCCKKFPGVGAINEERVLQHWLEELGSEIEERMMADTIENNRFPTQLVVNFSKDITSAKEVSCSRSFNLKRGSKLDGNFFAEVAFDLIKKDSKPFLRPFNQGESKLLMHPIKFLGLTIGKFEDAIKSNKISNFFAQNMESTNITLEKLALTNEQGDQEVPSQIIDDGNVEVSGSKKNTSPNKPLSKQESFFMNYFKNEPTTSHSSTGKYSEIGEEKELKDSFTVRRKSVRDSDELCDSDDSIGTIDMEINTSKQLFDPKEEPCAERPGLGAAFSKLAEGYRIPDEFLPPLIKPQTRQYISCEECNKSVLSNEYSMHLDYHLAVSLRLDDAKSDDKVKQQQSPTKPKPSRSAIRVSNIRDFFKVPNSVDLESCDVELCIECGKYVKLSEYSEHLDYHEAKKLSIELNSNKPVNLDSSGSSTGSNKRKMSVSPKDRSKKARKDTRTRSIDSFFK